MKLAVISLNTENKNLSQYYNSQAEGLAKALSEMGHELTVYHLVPDLDKEREHLRKDSVRIEYMKCRHIGKHALIDCAMLDADKECYITASDNYLMLGKFVKWCRKNRILCLPYIGVIHSNNSSAIKRKIVDILCNNVKFYKRMPTVVKTPALEKSLRKAGANKLFCVPVGLDTALLKQDYKEYSVENLKKKWNYEASDQIILFVGRMTAEKQPEKMISIFKRMYENNHAYRLLMVGQGELSEQVRNRIAEMHLDDRVTIHEKVPNDHMWELYRMSVCYINLNTHEIFGMAILEAMYYENVVIALKAPGPELIIENGVSGYICENEDKLIQRALEADKAAIGKAAHLHVEECFLWKNSAKKIEKIICDILSNGSFPASMKGNR
ncbi:MAG: glycosyltransferase family 4 protein [Lachnospiraceae bacterium]|nr:glycosyltransferase family 4 protein [Lachnospiraceae bacterium]